VAAGSLGLADVEPLAEPDGVETEPLAEPGGVLPVCASANATKPTVANAISRVATLFMLHLPGRAKGSNGGATEVEAILTRSAG
jgi:hypothetical protein